MKNTLKKLKRKTLCIILSVAMLISASCCAVFAIGPSYTEYVKGDLTHDGYFNIADLTFLQMCLAQLETPNYSTYEADFNGSGRVDVSDVTFGQRIIAGLETFSSASSNNNDTIVMGNLVSTTAPTDENHYFNTAFAEQFRELINDYREENGLNRLEYRADIQEISYIRAQDIVTLFTYVRKNGKSCFSLYNERNIDFKYVSESFSMGGSTPKTALRVWKAQPNYVSKMLNPNITGISTSCYVYVTDNGTERYWVADFIG